MRVEEGSFVRASLSARNQSPCMLDGLYSTPVYVPPRHAILLHLILREDGFFLLEIAR